MFDKSLWKLSIGLLATAATLAIGPLPAEATIDSVKVESSRADEEHRGYTVAEITIEGSVTRPDGSRGHYSVPAVLMYPRAGQGNQAGVVDWLNTSFYHFFPPDTEFGTFQLTLFATGSHLFDQGYTYLSIQWNKAVTEIFGPTVPGDGGQHNRMVYGSIERGADAWEILRDAARLLKDPSALPRRNRPGRVDTVVSSGYSQGAALQLEFITQRFDPTKIYDGHLVQMIGLACFKRDDEAPHFGFFGSCGPLPTAGNHAPVMLLASETDMLVYHPTVLGFGKSAFFSRNAGNPKWRQYELAGTAHLPASVFPLGLPNQDVADPKPIFRAAFDNLVRWARVPRRLPPASRHFEGTVDGTDAFVPVLDADHHFAGGLRLPHVDSRVGGRVAGAPLGTHAPLNPAGLTPFHPFIFVGGTFSPFTGQQLEDRYPSQEQYVTQVRRSAEDLAAKRYINDRDRKALVNDALKRTLTAEPTER